MKSIFTQTAEHRITSTTSLDCLNDLPGLIRKHTDWDYSCAQTDTGCFLNPTFRNMPYRNSFVPEIDVVVSHNDTQTVLYMRGRPVMFVRVFMTIWFSFVLMMEALTLAMAITSNLDSLFPVFIPIILCVFGYLLCKIATASYLQVRYKSHSKGAQIIYSRERIYPFRFRNAYMHSLQLKRCGYPTHNPYTMPPPKTIPSACVDIGPIDLQKCLH